MATFPVSFASFSAFGQAIRSLVNDFTTLHTLLARDRSHSFFLRDCLEAELIPKGLRLPFMPRSQASFLWKQRAERDLVRVLRNDARAALGLCASAGASFLRVNVHVGAADGQ